jgi:hypothetical protein
MGASPYRRVRCRRERDAERVAMRATRGHGRVRDHGKFSRNGDAGRPHEQAHA